jgi:hypothetical protein
MPSIAPWLRANGVSWDESAITLASGEGVAAGHGIVAQRDLEAGEVLARIPKASVLSSRTTSIADILASADLEADVALNIAIAYELARGRKSRFHGYLETLPRSENLPHEWADARASEILRGTEVAEHAATHRQRLTSEFETHARPLLAKHSVLGNSGLTAEAYAIAATLNSSRAFFVDERHQEALVPLMDLFNHKCQRKPVGVRIFGQDSHADDNDDSDGKVCIHPPTLLP